MTRTIARPGTELVVHIGLPKTGTTFLQNQVFRTFSQVADFGKTASYHVERPHVYEALKMIRNLPGVEFKTRSSSIKAVLRREDEQATIQHPAAACRLLSYEGFFHPHSIHPIDIYTRLESIFGRFKILITIRQQFEWIESLYLYKFYRFLKGGRGSFEAWAERSRTCPSRIRCQAATGSWTKSRQWEIQRILFSSAQAPCNVASILDSARELGIRDAQPDCRSPSSPRDISSCTWDEPSTVSRMVQQSGRDSLRESPRPGRWLAEGAHRRLRTGLTRSTFSYSPSLAG